MKTRTVFCSRDCLSTSVSLPASKSISNRLLMIRAISRQGFSIGNLSEAEDTVMLEKYLGMISHHQGSAEELVLDVGNAGTVMRFLTAYLATLSGDWILTGFDRMKERPLGPLVKALQTLGADIRYAEKTGYPPVIIRGTDLNGGEVTVDASVSSQFVSALLLVAPTLKSQLTVYLRDPVVSRPYMQMTIRLMQDYGIEIEEDDHKIVVTPGRYSGQPAKVEPDWSAASFWYEGAVLAAEARILIRNLSRSSLQGDSVLPKLFEPMGIKTWVLEEGMMLEKVSADREPLQIDFTNYPDVAVPVILAAGVSGFSGRFDGLAHLKVKECDRFAALTDILRTLGVPFGTTPEQDRIYLSGFKDDIRNHGAILKEAPALPIFRTYNDHRMAMACAMLALKFGKVNIDYPDSVAKSYPDFWNCFPK